MKILILKPSSLGDVVQALPVLRLLKLHFPKSEIFWWIDSTLRALLEDDPDLSGIFPFERRRWSSPFRWGEMLASIREMRREKFDWVIDLQSLARSGLFAWLTNGGLTIGLDDVREGARGFYDVAVALPAPAAHAVDWYLETLRVVGVPVHWNFTWLPERKTVATAVRVKWRADARRWLVLQPGARWDNKRWPVENFAELVRRLTGDFPEFHFAIMGGKQDQALGESLARVEPKRCFDLTGKTSLPEMVEWIRLSELMVTNDTGPMHVAAALGKPVVALFGPTDPRWSGPFGQINQAMQLASLPCVPCLKDFCAYIKPIECLRGLSPAVVHAEVHRRLSELKR